MNGSSVVNKSIAEEELSPLEWQAVRIASEKRARDLRKLLTPGKEQAIDVRLRVFGFVDVGQDRTEDRAETVRAVELLALVLSLVSTRTRNSIVRSLVAAGTQKKRRSPVPDDIKALAAQVMAAIAVRTPTVRSGDVTGSLRAAKL